MLKKVGFVILGNIIIGISVGVTLYCNFGIDACTTFYNGISISLGTGLGNTMAVLNSILFIFMFFIDRSTIHLGTFVNMFGVGYIIQFVSQFLEINLGPTPLLFRVFLYLVAVFVLCIGVGMYLSPNLGQAPWDAFANLFILLFKKGNYAKIRVIQDLIALSIGCLLGSVIGFGTIILAFTLGPGISYFSHYFSKYL